mmetsp:Transcript_39564/g.84270  ORF Transcript_39564/g.84270 Transcript_39564/m.84270 type:complete len:171 (-) Transcript_39564:276-788(-)
MTARDCPSDICGVWVQDMKRCESLCPFLEGLGLPKSMLWAACPIADNMRTTLRISCPDAKTLEIVDKTSFGRNSTRVTLDGSEVEKTAKGGRKTYMMSAFVEGDRSVVQCRLTSRGEGWRTRQERFLAPTKQGQVDVLVERHVLQRPGADEIAISRYYRKTEEDVSPKTE